MSITINGANSSSVEVSNVSQSGSELYVDSNGDNTMQDEEKLGLTKAELQALAGNSTATGSVTLEQLLASISDSAATGQVTGSLDKLHDILNKITALKQRIETAEAAGKDTTQMEATLAALINEAEAIGADVRNANMSTAQTNRYNGLVNDLNAKGANLQTAETAASGSGGGGSGTATGTTESDGGTSQPKAGFSYKSGLNDSAGAGAGAGAGGGGFMGSDGKFSMNNYLASTYNDQNIMNGWDQVNKNQSDQKKMMMLFFYFARMAASGDMGAMYRFMQFITWIISKDKALMNINMASKVIELENRNREALQELLDAPVPDSSDQKGQYEFTKIMERTKAMESSVATSQKLIAQMMEEMSQVVESLTSSTMEALHANGRILRKVSQSG